MNWEYEQSYWNFVLFPIMVLTRKLLPGGGDASDVKSYPAPIEALCRAATGFECALLQGGWRFPFGRSLIAIARRHDRARTAVIVMTIRHIRSCVFLTFRALCA